MESNNVHHSHDEENDQQKVAIFKSQLKNIERNNRTLPSSKIIDQLVTSMELTETQLVMIPRRHALYQTIYRARSETIPSLPKSLPNTPQQGCLFYLYQCLTKKLKKFGLWAYY
ncbi:unnamed protein product [Rotaria sp. Silwood2]|nr:unnamed protein product [Rotaria sp. Silwood2]